MKNNEIILKKDREFALLKGHPWIYGEAVKEIGTGIKTGTIVSVFSHKKHWLGQGYIDVDSRILVRMLPLARNESVNKGIKRLVSNAIRLRKSFFNETQTNAYRLINGEGDFLPGLIVDRYAEAVSIQVYSLGLEPVIDLVIEQLCQELPEIKYIWRRNQIRVAKTAYSGLIKGRNLPPRIRFLENGLNFVTDLVNGQKTGFFLDQRDNRNLIRQLADKKSFLNICGYTGAFTVAAAAGQATDSVTVDIAKPALEEAKNNLELNNFSLNTHKLVCADMYDYLQECRQKFGLVVLDPPSMAKSKKDQHKAIRAYQKLNILGMKVVEPGGLLFTASCSSQVSREDFACAVKDAAVKAKVKAQIIQERFHACDHPTSLCHPEGRYLKGMLLRIL